MKKSELVRSLQAESRRSFDRFFDEEHWAGGESWHPGAATAERESSRQRASSPLAYRSYRRGIGYQRLEIGEERTYDRSARNRACNLIRAEISRSARRQAANTG